MSDHSDTNKESQAKNSNHHSTSSHSSDSNLETTSLGKSGFLNILRSVAIVSVTIALFAIIIANSSTRQSPADQVWDESTTVGNLDASNYYVMYTDLICPYCDVFSRVVMENWDKFTAYLDEHDILFEVRLTDYLYEASGSEYSRAAAEGAYCAMREDKFWDYYHGALTALWDDYHSKGIGDSKTSPSIKNLPSDYWLNIGHAAGLGDEFDNCVKNHETVSEIENNTRRALQVANGMPTFKFNDFTTYGFSDSWGWDYVEMYLDAGLNKSNQTTQ